MEQSILTAIKFEEQQLAMQLASLLEDYNSRVKPIQKQLDALKAVRAAYDFIDAIEHQPQLFKQPRLSRPRVSLEPDRPGTFKAQALEVALNVLKQGAIPTRQLVEILEKEGVVFGTDKKAENLSVILSKDDRVVSDRKLGWSLAEKNPQDAVTSTGSVLAEASNNLKAPE